MSWIDDLTPVAEWAMRNQDLRHGIKGTWLIKPARVGGLGGGARGAGRPQGGRGWFPKAGVESAEAWTG